MGRKTEKEYMGEEKERMGGERNIFEEKNKLTSIISIEFNVWLTNGKKGSKLEIHEIEHV